jgi:DNA-binding NtrC family response regulator
MECPGPEDSRLLDHGTAEILMASAVDRTRGERFVRGFPRKGVPWEPAVTTGDGKRDVLLIAADLNERRLVYGELLEAGYDVLPLPGMAAALGTLLQHSVAPRLVLVDVQGDEHATPQSVRQLLALAPGVPSIVLVGAINRAVWQPIESQVTALLARPITVGKIVETVQAALPVPPRAG